MAHPLGLAFDYKLGRPRIAWPFLLWPRKTINVRSVLCDEHKVAKIAHDQLRFVCGTDRTLYLLETWLGRNVIERGKFRSVKEKLLFVRRYSITHLFLLYKSRASGLKENQILI